MSGVWDTPRYCAPAKQRIAQARKRRYRVWFDPEWEHWCVSPDHGDGKTRRPAFIRAATVERALKTLEARIKR